MRRAWPLTATAMGSRGTEPVTTARNLREGLRAGHRCRVIAAVGLALAAGTVQSQGTRSAAGIYTCVDAQGRKLTSDRPIPECTAREQRVLNQDGSVRQVVPPTLTPEERAERDAAERRAALQRAAQADAARRDRNLIARYPDEAAHRRARAAALEPVRQAMKSSVKRLDELSAERRKLDDEAEFYQRRSLPAYLKQKMDANDAGAEALRAATRTQEAEMVRIHALYDAELLRLKRLWAGAAPGSVAPEPPASAGSAAASAVASVPAAPARKSR
jgi:Domain of unknown function (DUF4124)